MKKSIFFILINCIRVFFSIMTFSNAVLNALLLPTFLVEVHLYKCFYCASISKYYYMEGIDIYCNKIDNFIP